MQTSRKVRHFALRSRFEILENVFSIRFPFKQRFASFARNFHLFSVDDSK